MNFIECTTASTPNGSELREFIAAVIDFLYSVAESDETFSFLWEDDQELQALPRDFFVEVRQSGEELQKRILEIPDEVWTAHGLVDSSARFKFRVLAFISKGWERFWDQFKMRYWFRSMIAAIDAIFDSVVKVVVGHIGGLIKEFKDPLPMTLHARAS